MKPRLLYFTRGQIDTKTASEIVKKFPKYSVAFRDSKKVSEIENCDAVSGFIPTDYFSIFSVIEESAEIDKQTFEVYGKIEAFQLPVMTKGAIKFVKDNKISDEVLSRIKPTGKYGLLKTDIVRFLAKG